MAASTGMPLLCQTLEHPGGCTVQPRWHSPPPQLRRAIDQQLEQLLLGPLYQGGAPSGDRVDRWQGRVYRRWSARIRDMPLREFRNYVRTHAISARCEQSMRAERRKDRNGHYQRQSRERKQSVGEQQPQPPALS